MAFSLQTTRVNKIFTYIRILKDPGTQDNVVDLLHIPHGSHIFHKSLKCAHKPLSQREKDEITTPMQEIRGNLHFKKDKREDNLRPPSGDGRKIEEETKKNRKQTFILSSTVTSHSNILHQEPTLGAAAPAVRVHSCEA